ncbi:hypothetical protein MSKU15_1305 [Komagataeibacter diospyri]|uniref:hypothetical protein n=1 Tax=Komagataeibacter diospyri TaxID=1932662 RepID=UPI00113B090D|nr:hypothetical protein [Komagataeibacter diospyri]GCE89704.1 hypothetical protein MSKU15_1305 [Komagataeibacter diospyri]
MAEDTTTSTAIPAPEGLLETVLGKRDTATTQADIQLAGTVLQLLIPVIVARAAPNLDLAGVDAAVTKIVGGVADLKTAIEAKPATVAATVASARAEAPHPVVPGQPAH